MPRQITLQGEAYNLPIDTLYYIEGADRYMDDEVRIRLPYFSRLVEERGNTFCPIGLTSETLAQYLALRPDVSLPIPDMVKSPCSALSGFLLCRLPVPAMDENYTFLALDTNLYLTTTFERILEAFLDIWCPLPPEPPRLEKKSRAFRSRIFETFDECESMCGSMAPAPCEAAEPEIDVRHQFIDELQRRLDGLSDEGVNIFLQTLGNDFLKSIKDLAPKPLSPLYIDENYRILLPDYDLEIKMNAIWRAIYILFLRHEEGIILKDLWSFRDELAAIYKRIASGEYERMEATIDDVTTPGSDNFRQYLSKINRAFNAVLAVDLAQHYTISGVRGGAYLVRLPHDKITLCPKLQNL